MPHALLRSQDNFVDHELEELNTTSNEYTNKAIEDFDQYVIGNYIWIYVSPILLIVGTVGNLLSIAVLLRKRMRRSTTMFYLTCLSFADLFTLYTGLLRYWIRRAFDVDIRNLSDMGCKIHTFLVYVSLDLTVWILVSVTVDRCLSVSFPFKAKRMCTLKRSKWMVIIILTVLVLINMHFLWQLELVDTWEFRCDANSEAADNFYNYVWPWIDLCVFCLVPFTVMIICNAKIIYQIVLSQRKLDAHKCLNTKPKVSTVKFSSQVSNPGVSEITMPSTVFSQNNHDHGDRNNHNTDLPNDVTSSPTSSHRISSLTAMLLSVNCVFLITTSPIMVFLIGEEYWFSAPSTERIATHNFWWAIVNMFQYFNNAIHFFLYCLTGPRFRREFKSMFNRNNKIDTLPRPPETEM